MRGLALAAAIVATLFAAPITTRGLNLWRQEKKGRLAPPPIQ
jgi:hypothetical protein